MPRQSPLDLISRIVMLALAAMVTLSVVGVIEAIPRGAMQERVGIARQQPVPQQPQPEPQPQERQAPEPQSEPNEPRQAEPGSSGGVVGPAVFAPPPPEDEDVERWLEAITYALMALAGLMGIATLILWRSLRERRRIADALEALSAQRT